MSDQHAFPASAVRSRAVGRSAKTTMPTKSRHTFGKKPGITDSALSGLSSSRDSSLAHHGHNLGSSALRCSADNRNSDANNTPTNFLLRT